MVSGSHRARRRRGRAVKIRGAGGRGPSQRRAEGGATVVHGAGVRERRRVHRRVGGRAGGAAWRGPRPPAWRAPADAPRGGRGWRERVRGRGRNDGGRGRRPSCARARARRRRAARPPWVPAAAGPAPARMGRGEGGRGGRPTACAAAAACARPSAAGGRHVAARGRRRRPPHRFPLRRGAPRRPARVARVGGRGGVHRHSAAPSRHPRLERS